ncbi:MAG: DUF1553 domain-containing protein [Gemmataceae bacterium]|nr:DUF1553 domain-containing protein [Gemmataceae bacterium]
MVRFLASTLLFFAALAASGQDGNPAPQEVVFNRDIRPILSDTCFHCHGPDKSKRKGDLRLDTAEGAVADRGGYAAIVPGKPEQSALLERVTAKEKSKRMPPATSAHGPLNEKQIDVLRRWIAQGAKYQQHWSFIAPARPKLPAVKNKAWTKNPIDHFVLARLEEEGLKPSPAADRITLLRRVSLDLTGLPPTPAEVDDFLADASPGAYEKVVDRLLTSPRFGERMAQRWLDAARYADTNGYQTDGDRIMWRWRDWVIDAYNANMPFDQFTIEQIAGDMLPDATLDEKIATGFNRNHRANSEGGVIPEEYAVEYVVDRVDTTATVWLGLSAGCAKCHDHKYDPVSQKEFYQLFAYFNNVPERGKAIKYGNSPPYIKTPTNAHNVHWKLLQSQLKATSEVYAHLQPELGEAQLAWEKTLSQPIDWTLTRGLLSKFNLDNDFFIRTESEPKDGASTTILNGETFQPIRLRIVPGKIGNAVYFDGRQQHVEAGDVGAFGFYDKFSMGAWIKPEQKGGTILSRMVDSDRADGYSVAYLGGRIHVHLVKRWLDDAIRVETEAALAHERWHHVFFTYDGSRVAEGIKIYVNGEPAKLKVNLDDLNQSFNTKEPFRIGAGGGPENRFHGAIDDVRIYDHAVPADDVALIANLDNIDSIVKTPLRQRTPTQAHKLRSYFLEQHAPEHVKYAFGKWRNAEKELADFEESIPTTMVMVEMPTPRDTHILLRGEYDKPGARVLPGIPDALPRLPAGAANNRLGFAQWLVDRSNPLTARVTVNRFWQMLFGAGIVRTVEDFGAQGDWPSHPELLDWLAVEFMDPTWDVGENCCQQGTWAGVKNWDVKHILKTIVTSATYRQSSKATKELLQKDPDNRLFARGPRFRLSADVIRDQALSASGLLVERIGGPSVKPYQPLGLEKELHGTDDAPHDQGANLYRRSLYTYWKRTVAPPALLAFDAANRETCVVRETRTNTPLQALNLMNDVTFVEAARVLAERAMKEGGVTAVDRVRLMFRLAACRPPTDKELRLLVESFNCHLDQYSVDVVAARKLVGAGDSPRDPALNAGQLAAYTALANTILNLDEVITKE